MNRLSTGICHLLASAANLSSASFFRLVNHLQALKSLLDGLRLFWVFLRI
jgi:hypothetical protein